MGTSILNIYIFIQVFLFGHFVIIFVLFYHRKKGVDYVTENRNSQNPFNLYSILFYWYAIRV